MQRDSSFRCFYIFRAVQPNSSQHVVLKYNGRPEIRVSGTVTCGGSPGFTRIQSAAAALSPECAPQCWHKRCHFSICTPYKARLWCCARVLLIWFQMKSLLSYFVGPCRGMQIFPSFSVGWAFCGQFHCQPQNRSLTDTLCFTPTAPPMRFCLQLSLQLFVRRRWDCVVVISRQFKPSAEEGWQSERAAVWASGWKWIIPRCLSGSPLPPRISLFLNAECTWRGLRSQCLSVCNLAPSLLRRTLPSVKSDTAASALHSVWDPAN